MTDPQDPRYDFSTEEYDRIIGDQSYDDMAITRVRNWFREDLQDNQEFPEPNTPTDVTREKELLSRVRVMYNQVMLYYREMVDAEEAETVEQKWYWLLYTWADQIPSTLEAQAKPISRFFLMMVRSALSKISPQLTEAQLLYQELSDMCITEECMRLVLLPDRPQGPGSGARVRRQILARYMVSEILERLKNVLSLWKKVNVVNTIPNLPEQVSVNDDGNVRYRLAVQLNDQGYLEVDQTSPEQEAGNPFQSTLLKLEDIALPEEHLVSFEPIPFRIDQPIQTNNQQVGGGRITHEATLLANPQMDFENWNELQPFLDTLNVERHLDEYPGIYNPAFELRWILKLTDIYIEILDIEQHIPEPQHRGATRASTLAALGQLTRGTFAQVYWPPPGLPQTVQGYGNPSTRLLALVVRAVVQHIDSYRSKVFQLYQQLVQICGLIGPSLRLRREEETDDRAFGRILARRMALESWKILLNPIQTFMMANIVYHLSLPQTVVMDQKGNLTLHKADNSEERVGNLYIKHIKFTAEDMMYLFK